MASCRYGTHVLNVKAASWTYDASGKLFRHCLHAEDAGCSHYTSVCALSPHEEPPKCGAQGTTRLLVSHQRHHLPMCDRIIVLRGGCIVADGTLQQLQSQGYEAELGSGHGSGQMAELDDTAYDQGMAHPVSLEPGKDSSSPVASPEGQVAMAQSEQIRAVGRNGSEAEQARACLPTVEDAAGKAQPARNSRQDASYAASATAQQPGSIQAEQVKELAAGQQLTGAERTGGPGKVQIPSSVFGTEDPASAGAKRADMPEAVQRVRGPFGTLRSRVSRRSSRPAGSISGAPSMGGQMRTLLSR